MSALPVAVQLRRKPVADVGGQSDRLGAVVSGEVQHVEPIEHGHPWRSSPRCAAAGGRRRRTPGSGRCVDEVGPTEFDQPAAEQVAAVAPGQQALASRARHRLAVRRLRQPELAGPARSPTPAGPGPRRARRGWPRPGSPRDARPAAAAAAPIGPRRVDRAAGRRAAIAYRSSSSILDPVQMMRTLRPTRVRATAGHRRSATESMHGRLPPSSAVEETLDDRMQRTAPTGRRHRANGPALTDAEFDTQFDRLRRWSRPDTDQASALAAVGRPAAPGVPWLRPHRDRRPSASPSRSTSTAAPDNGRPCVTTWSTSVTSKRRNRAPTRTSSASTTTARRSPTSTRCATSATAVELFGGSRRGRCSAPPAPPGPR